METNKGFLEQLERLDKDLLTQDYRWEVLADGQDKVPWQLVKDGARPVGAEEVALIKDLRERWRLQLNHALSPDEDGTEDISATPVFAELMPKDNDRYQYYQPVYWKASCVFCHGEDRGSLAASDLSRGTAAAAPPFRVIKIIMPR